MEKIFLHADLDAFFASVEQLDHPEYRGKPVIVSGLPGDRRCVVSTASYEARLFGVHSAMPAKTAFKLCPHGIFVRPDMHRYHEKSHEVMSIFRQYSPDVIQMSVDEAFIDLTGTERLLGPAEETAKRIKKQVKEETGLTISIGMASTMYLAKIASGYRKPDGLTIIRPGDEEKFMLSLPLNKLWGAGEKTLERLNKAGFRTTQQIYNKSENLLQSIFGENTGSFLYNSVRGNKNLLFGTKAENHSISSEKTFEYDLTDRDAIETALLQLAHTVMFRLHRENVHSRTLALKIRYDDFTTVSIQQTGERNFSSVDDLFERCVNLFYKKYNKESGIRLLGVSADKVEDNSIPSQKELFDFGEEKKSKIEKTILKLEDKLPGVKIQKARTLHKAILLLIPLLAFSLLEQKPLHAEEIINEQSDSSDEEIVFFKEKNNLFELKAKGFWEADINTGVNATFGYGRSFSSSFSAPVFTQKADLTLTAQFSRKFYFEGIFADTFAKNTIAAVYKTEGILKELRFANRGIIFPKTYSVSKTGYSIGGGQNLAPGILLHLQNDKFVSDTVLRYDMLSFQSKTFYGMNSVSSFFIEPGNFINGREFVLPLSTHITDIDSIYVENIDGSYFDSEGRKYKKLSSSEYLLNAVNKTIYFTKEAGTSSESRILPAVLVTFRTLSKSQIASETGSYSDSSSFLGKIQDYFNSNEKFNGCDLQNYSYILFNEIDGQFALVIQKGSFFSPFAVCCKYDAGFISGSDALVVNSHSKIQITDYSVSSSEADETHLWLTVKSSDTNDTSLPEYRYPFAKDENAYYLNKKSVQDFAIESRTYSEVTNYFIGTNASEESVCVYINEIQDEGAAYSSETGIVTPSVRVNNQDKVYITWSEDNSSYSYGSIAFASAAKYLFTDKFSSDISLTGRWTLPYQQSYASSAYSFPGFAAFTAGLKYETEKFTAENTFVTALENQNTSGKYRILSMDDFSEKQFYLTENSAVNLPENSEISLNGRNNHEQSIYLKKEYNGTSSVNKITSDSEIEGYTVPLEWNFSSFMESSSDGYAWAARTIDLGSYADELSGADLFNIALYSPFTYEDTKFYLQLGVSTDTNYQLEDIFSVPTWCISRPTSGKNPEDVIYGFVTDKTSFSNYDIEYAKHLSDKWQQVTVKISEKDRINLLQNKGARIIAVKPLSSINENTNSSKGILYAGPWSLSGTSFVSDYDKTFFNVHSFQYDKSADEGTIPSDEIINLFNSITDNTVQSFRWNTISVREDFSDKSNFLTFRKYFEPVSLDSYKKLNFYFKYNPVSEESNLYAKYTEDSLITIDFESNELNNTWTPSVHLEISSEEAELLKGLEWHSAVIDLDTNTLFIDNTQIQPEKYKLLVNKECSVSSVKILLNVLSKNSGCLYKSGTFEIDEIYLSETSTDFVNKDNIHIAYKNEDSLLKIKNTVLLGNIDFNMEASGISAKKLSSDDDTKLSANGNARLNFDSLNINYGINAGMNYSSSSFKQATVSSNAQNITGLSLFNYSVKTKSPLFKVLNFSSDFTSNIISAIDTTSSQVNISFAELKFPLTINFSTQSSSSLFSVSQNASSSISFNSKHYALNVQADFSQKLPSEYNSNSLKEDFISIQQNAFSTGRHDASLRTEYLTVKNSFIFADGKIAPSFTIKGSGNKEEYFNDSVSFIFEMPVKINDQSFSFGISRLSSSENQVFSDTIHEYSSAYADDISIISNNIKNREWFWKAIPFADLFTPVQNDSLNSFIEKNNSNYYISWTKPITYRYIDLLIPSGASISFSRETLSSTTVSDYYLLKLQTLFSALNIFGKAGTIPIFKWYTQDYFSTYVSTDIKIPREDPHEVTLGFNINVDDNFYLPQDGLIQLTFGTYFENSENFNINSYLTWKRKADSSPLILLIALFTDKIKTKNLSLIRKDIFSYQFVKSHDTQSTLKQIDKIHTASISHSLEAVVNKYFTITTGISGTYSVYENKYLYCSLLFSLGGKLNF